MRERALPRLVVVVLLLSVLPAGLHVSAFTKPGGLKVQLAGDAVAIDTINGRAPNGEIQVRPGQPLTIKGSSGTASAETVVADAGDSAFIEAGTTARLVGSAAGGQAPYTFAWSSPLGRLIDADGPAVTFDTADLTPGVVDVTLTATDAAGRSASDVVKVAVYELSSQTVLTASGDTLVGVPDEIASSETGGNVDGQSVEHRFTVPNGSRDLTVTLDWGQDINDFDLVVWGEGLTGDLSGLSASKPETVSEATPSNAYVAKVDAFLSLPDTYTLTATTVAPPPDLRPKLLVADPFRFEVGETQTLRAETTGGTGATKVSWDLDANGTYEAAGAVVQTAFPLGTHLVTAKVTDAAGFESRETVPVRIVPPGSQLGASPFVVIAINDTGINPYHRDYSAETYPDRAVLEGSADFTRHPSEYLPGYPSDAEALPVTLGAGFLPEQDCPDIAANPTTGDPVLGYDIVATCAGGLWNPDRIEGGKLYWIPGTKIIGAISSQPDAHPILDDNGHGTGASSVSAGNTYGSCPACLLVFDEGFGSDWASDQEWIDVVSNSYGNINLAPDTPVNLLNNIVDVKRAVERGQTWLFASGNGHGNSFVLPNTTYTQEHNGPDWILRVGAVDSGNRQPILGDGMPADVSSFGTGPLPSADPISASAASSFSGTSAASPITSGVFGVVLAAARDALGDVRVGQRDASAVASGEPVPGSPYLDDGTLTRGELWELVLKTAQPGAYPATDVSAFTTTYPLEQLHYLFEGYGIADEASAAHAIDVMLGGSPLPVRAEEDDFFARDSALRVALYGGWTGFDEQYGTSGADAAAGFGGAERDEVATFDAALRVLDPDRTLRGGSSSDAGVSSAASAGSAAATGLPLLVSPTNGATYDATVIDAVPAAGNAGTRPGTQTLRRFARQAQGTADDECGGEQFLSADSGTDDPECTFPGQNLTYVGAGFGNFESSFALRDSLPIRLDAHRPVTGTIHLDGQSVSPETILLVTLRTGGAIVGWQRVSGAFGGDGPVAFDFSFPVAPRFAGVPLDRLELVVGLRRSNGLAHISLTEPASFVDIALAPADDRTVAFSIDGADPTIVPVDERDGSWGSNIDLNPLATGRHTIRATESASGATQTASFDVVRPPAVRVVEVALLGANDAPIGGWTAGRFDRAGVRWAARTTAPSVPGSYPLVARIRQGTTELARSHRAIVRVG